MQPAHPPPDLFFIFQSLRRSASVAASYFQSYEISNSVASRSLGRGEHPRSLCYFPVSGMEVPPNLIRSRAMNVGIKCCYNHALQYSGPCHVSCVSFDRCRGGRNRMSSPNTREIRRNGMQLSTNPRSRLFRRQAHGNLCRSLRPTLAKFLQAVSWLLDVPETISHASLRYPSTGITSKISRPNLIFES